MPTYEYACKSCGEHLEVVQSFSDDALTTCPSCEGELRKVYSAAGIIFKGSGWHIKDYSSKNGSSTTAPAPSGSPESGSSDAGSSDGGGSKDTTSSKKSDSSSSSSSASTPTSNAAGD